MSTRLVAGASFIAAFSLLFSACSPAPEPSSTEAADESSAPVALDTLVPGPASVEPQEQPEPEALAPDPTLEDLPVPPVSYQPEPAAEPAEPLPTQSAVGEQPRFWYKDIPEEKAGQQAMRAQLDADYRRLERDLSLARQTAVASNPELKALQQNIEEARAQRADFLASAPEMLSLADTQKQRMDRLASLDREAKTLLEEVKKEAEANPELLAEPHQIAQGCCGFHKPEAPREETILDRYHAKLAEHRASLMEVSRHALERGQLERDLSTLNPQLRDMDEAVARIQAEYSSALESQPGLRDLQRHLDDLNNKRLYLGRVIMGDTRYFTPSENRSSPN